MQENNEGVIHLYLAWTLIILSILHAVVALKHHLIDGDVSLKRMLEIYSRK